MLEFLQSLFGASQSPPQPRPAGAVAPVRAGVQSSAPAAPGANVVKRVRDLSGVEKTLGSELARGGEGVVYRVSGRDDALVKLYHRRVLDDPAAAGRLRRKVEAMTDNSALRASERLAWPCLSLFDCATGEWRGYAMRFQKGTSLQGLIGAPCNLLEFAPHWNRTHLASLCLDFLDTIETLAAQKALPVDFNPCNFLVDVERTRFRFIDCDGYQFRDGSDAMHLCEAIRPDLAPPELHRRQRWDEAPVGPESLRFSIGMVLFFILNLGNNPYRHRNGRDPVENLLSGKCGLGKGADCPMPPGPWYVIWSHLSFQLKANFIRCFRDGHADPSARPTVPEWREALSLYQGRLLKGKADAALIPAKAKASSGEAGW